MDNKIGIHAKDVRGLRIIFELLGLVLLWLCAPRFMGLYS